MEKILNKLREGTFNNYILGGFLVCLVLAPSFYILNFRFKFQLIDFFMPIFLGMIIYNKWYKNWNLLYVKNFLFLIGVIICSILINKQWTGANEWFEIYRVFKYFLVFILFKELCPPKINTVIIDIIFVSLLLINFLHYHNIFDFNQIVMSLYCGEGRVHLTHFGLNSAGLPAVKRMIGTMANPNDNAILFLVFMLFYLPRKEWKVKDMCFFILCLVAFLACQSRTSLVAFFVIIFVNFLIIRIKWQKVLAYSGMIMLVMTVFFYNYKITDFFHSKYIAYTETNRVVIDTVTSLITDTAISQVTDPVIIPVTKPVETNYSLTLLDGTAVKSDSWTIRVSLWKDFLSQFFEHPILGHAPQKNHFYEQKLYFENEYVLFLWRYGILGFIAFVGFYLIPLKKIFKTMRSSDLSKNTLLLILLFAICGLTNVPLTNTILSLLFFSYLGIFYSQKRCYDK